jgi:hypothetical protein
MLKILLSILLLILPVMPVIMYKPEIFISSENGGRMSQYESNILPYIFICCPLLESYLTVIILASHGSPPGKSRLTELFEIFQFGSYAIEKHTSHALRL